MQALRITASAWKLTDNNKWRLNFPILLATITIIPVILFLFKIFLPWLDGQTFELIHTLQTNCNNTDQSSCLTLKIYKTISETGIDIIITATIALFEVECIRQALAITDGHPNPPASGLQHWTKIAKYTILIMAQTLTITIPHYLVTFNKPHNNTVTLLSGALGLTLYFALQLVMPIYLATKKSILSSIIHSFRLSQNNLAAVLLIGIINFLALIISLMSYGICFIWLGPLYFLNLTVLYQHLSQPTK